MSKNRIVMLLILLAIFTLSACNQPSDKSVIRQNNEQSIVRELIDARLQNHSFEEINEIHTQYRTKMEYVVWENYFDVSQVHLHDLISITEAYNLVPKSYTITNTASDTKNGVNTYLYTTELKAVATGSLMEDAQMERIFTVYFMFKFDAEGVLVDFHTTNRLESAGGYE